MRDINVNGINKGPVRTVIPAEQAKRYVAPVQSTQPTRDYFIPKKSGSNKYLAVGLFLTLTLISVVFALATFAFDGASITVKPIKKETPISETIILSEVERKELTKVKSLNTSEEIVIAKNSNKKVYRKAEGVVMVYNDYSNQTQKLMKGTRIATNDNKVFRLLESVTVPGKTGAKPGSVQVKVQAENDGPTYNIGPSKFTIPGFKSSPKYKSFFAESTSSMSGGANGLVGEVSDAELQKATINIKKKLVEKVQGEIDTDVPDGFVFNKDSVALSLGKMEKVSEDDNSATYAQKATATTIFIKREEIVKNILTKQNTQENVKPIVKVLDTSKFEISISNLAEALKEENSITLTLTGLAPAIYYPNKQQILEYYAGRPVSEFPEIGRKFPFVESAQRVIYPLWAQRFPTNLAKITIEFEE